MNNQLTPPSARDLRRMRGIFEQMSREEGVPAEEIRHEIEIFIEISHLKAACNARAMARWEAIPCRGDLPTPEEFIFHCVQEIRHDLKTSRKDSQNGNRKRLLPFLKTFMIKANARKGD